MVHDVIEIIRLVRQHVKKSLEPNPRGTLNPANRIFHNADAAYTHGGNMPIMPKTVLSANVESKANANAIARLLRKNPDKLSGYYFDLHFTHPESGVPQIHLSIQGTRIGQLESDIFQEWNR